MGGKGEGLPVVSGSPKFLYSVSLRLIVSRKQGSFLVVLVWMEMSSLKL